MKTLLLDTVKWDLLVDASRNIAVAADPYSISQDAASAIKLFQKELYYDTTKGVPYFEQILGKWPPLSVVKAALEGAALTVPGVVKAKVFISSFEERAIKGQVQTTDSAGNTSTVAF